MWMRLLSLPFFLLLAALAGCAGFASDGYSRDVALGPGAYLELTASLTVPPRQAHVVIQDGAVVGERGRNPYHPNCVLYLRTLADGARTIGPLRFAITGSLQLEDTLASAGSLQFAALEGMRLAMVEGEAGHGVNLVTRLLLASAQAADVTRLDCGRWGDSGEDGYPDLAEIRATLGDLARVRVGR